MSDVITAGAGQVSAERGDVQANVRATCATMRTAADKGVRLLVLPECGLTGYAFDDPRDVRAVAVDVDGPEVEQIAELAQRLDMHVVIGTLEISRRVPGAVHNTALLIDPSRRVVPYRKAHLPSFGADRFVTPGDNEPVVVDTVLGRIGLSICYDLRFPEWARALALDGSDIIANPTNWAGPASFVARMFTPVRAAENHVFVIVANRGDAENGVRFIGNSRIVDPTGTTLAVAEGGEALLTATIAPGHARRKDVSVPGEGYAISLFGDRRPTLYEALVRPKPDGAPADQPSNGRSLDVWR